MKRNTILSAIAILLLVVFTGLGILLILLIIPLAYYFMQQKQKRIGVDEFTPHPVFYSTIDEAAGALGEPEAVIVVDPTRANEPDGVVMVFRNRGKIVIKGEEFSIADIVDVTMFNSATPYTVGQQQVSFTTRLKDREYIRLDAGYDSKFAAGVASDIRAAIFS